MKLSELRFAIVEDRHDAIENLLVVIKGAGMSLGHCVGKWTDFDGARAGLDAKCRDIDLLFLDLNIPLNANDSKPTKDHGRTILDLILNDLNRRGPHKMSVVIVSGEVNENYERNLWLGNYKAIVVGLAMKGQLTTALPEILNRYSEDPYTGEIRADWSAAEPYYQTLTDEEETAESRSLACLTLSCLLMRNIAQYEQKLPDQTGLSGKQLSDLIREYLARNFNPIKAGGPSFCNLKFLKGSAGDWVLRGYLIEHLYAINNFRNGIIHISDTGPFHDGAGHYGTWGDGKVPVERLENADRLCRILVMIVQDVLDWYLPWHRKVYAPWIKTLSASAGATK